MQLIKSAALVSVIILGAVAGCSSTTTIIQNDAAAPADAATKDTGTPKDTGASDSATNTCTPQDISGFTPTALTPPVAKPAPLCTSTDITTYIDNCVNPVNKTQCATVAATCVPCLLTPASAAKAGALIEGSGFVRANLAGCLQDLGNIACATAIDVESQCVEAACPDSVCPVIDDPSLQLLNACTTAAAKTKCKTQSDAATACLNSDAASIATCTSGTAFRDSFIAVATVMCGQ